MDTDARAVQRALAAEIRAEMARQNLTHKALREAAGISASAYRTHFRVFARDLPMSEYLAVCDVLGVSAGDVMARALAIVAGGTETPTGHNGA